MATKVSNYQILEEIARGGMGVVYRAEDLRLRRTVALKFLHSELLGNPTARHRFLVEAQAVSRLDHPNICTLYEIGESEDDALYLAMPFYQGETLRDRLRREPMEAAQTLRVVLDIARGLEAAHGAGIVHRDIKPGNVMLTANGGVKLLDFGVSRLVGSERVTRTGHAVGTSGYMAPEVLRGEPGDQRSDLWSLGILLYEMLAGHRPFQATPESALILSVLMDPPDALGSCGLVGRRDLAPVVFRALEKDPQRRYQSAEGLIRDLESPDEMSTEHSLRVLAPTSRPRSSIAVLPFADLSREQDQEYFCCGLAEELIHRLNGLEGLRVASRTSSFQFLDKGEDVRLIGHQLNVETVLEGSVRKSGDSLRITVQLIKAADGYHLWSERYDHQMEDLFEVQDEIARRVIEALRGTWFHEAPTLAPDPAPEPRMDAFHLFLQGRHQWDRRTEEGLRRSIDLFQRAIALQDDFARAHAALADAYAVLGLYGVAAPDEVMPAAGEAAQRALALDPGMAQVYNTLGLLRAVYEWDQKAAARDFRRALELDPQHAPAHHWYAMNYLIPQGKFAAARRHLGIALELDPLNLAVNTSMGLQRLFARRYQEAVIELRQTIEVDEGFAMAHFFLGRALDRMGRGEEAVAAIERAIELSGGSPEMRSALGCACVSIGDRRRASALLRELREIGGQRYVSPVLKARLQLRLGDQEAALTALEQAAGLRATDLIWLGVSASYDPLREHPRFIALVERLGLGGETAISSALPEESVQPEGPPVRSDDR